MSLRQQSLAVQQDNPNSRISHPICLIVVRLYNPCTVIQPFSSIVITVVEQERNPRRLLFSSTMNRAAALSCPRIFFIIIILFSAFRVVFCVPLLERLEYIIHQYKSQWEYLDVLHLKCRGEHTLTTRHGRNVRMHLLGASLGTPQRKFLSPI